MLLTNGADVNRVDYFGRSSLYIAARNGNERIVQSLIAKGADVNLGDKTGKSPLERARERGNFWNNSHKALQKRTN